MVGGSGEFLEVKRKVLYSAFEFSFRVHEFYSRNIGLNCEWFLRFSGWKWKVFKSEMGESFEHSGQCFCVFI